MDVRCAARAQDRVMTHFPSFIFMHFFTGVSQSVSHVVRVDPRSFSCHTRIGRHPLHSNESIHQGIIHFDEPSPLPSSSPCNDDEDERHLSTKTKTPHSTLHTQRATRPPNLLYYLILASTMRLTTVLAKAAAKSKGRSIRSVALSVHFKQPDFGMKEYEILSRASGFLLAVDPPDPEVDEGPYGHLKKNERDRKYKMYKQDHKYTPAGGPEKRELKDLGWLEFAPREVRPMVHCVCSSHVLAPFLWKDYYPQDWLSKVKQEHCAYSLEVFDPENPTEALGKFALNPYPIHHPEGRDIAFIHLKQEEENLKLMKDLGVQVHYLRDLDEIYEKGDEVTFDGYVVTQPNQADKKEFEEEKENAAKGNNNTDTEEEDTRIFYPYQATGKLEFHTKDRFFATTPDPLPEGLCGGPVFDEKGGVCGIVEGIVDKSHTNKEIAGSAAFMPNYMMTPFIEFAERFMLQRVLPKGLFQKAVTAKTTNTLGGGIFEKNKEGEFQPGTEASWEEAFDRAMEQLKKNHSKEEIEAIVDTVQRERKEAIEIMEKEGGDMDEIIQRVRQRTLEIRELIHEEYRKGNKPQVDGDDEEVIVGGAQDSSIVEGEVIDEKTSKR